MSRSVHTIHGLEGYGNVRALIRLHGVPIGYTEMPVERGRCSGTNLKKVALKEHRQAILHHLLCDSLAVVPRSDESASTDVVRSSHPVHNGILPPVTVAVCTRDRTKNLKNCLDSLLRLDYPSLDLLVIDNAPSNEETRSLVTESYPSIRYMREPRPGLDWARNRAILEGKGEIIAYTDDDVVVDPGWIKALATVFAEDPDVMAVTGLVVPFELETEAQILFEKFGGFGRGFERRWYGMGRRAEKGAAILHGGAGKFGTGANMAYRRTLFNKIGYFDPALDMGTVTNGAGDLEMFFRVVKEGFTLVYEPGAFVRHVHRRDFEELRTQIRDWGIAFYSYIVCGCMAYPEERSGFRKIGLSWLRSQIGSLRPNLIRQNVLMCKLGLAQLKGSFMGLFRYQKARRVASDIERTFGPLTQTTDQREKLKEPNPGPKRNGIALRTVDLHQPLQVLGDVKEYPVTRVLVTRNGNIIGNVDIPNHYQPVSKSCLQEAIAAGLNLRLLDGVYGMGMEFEQAQATAALAQHFIDPEDSADSEISPKLPTDISVSIVVATYDRPDALRECVRGLLAQETQRPVEIIVADNHPQSEMTPSVMNEFPGIRVVREPRKGVSYARNAGIGLAKGEIVITVDDDVTVTTDWLEKLLSPFVRDDVMAVTGNVLPGELETPAQRLFEEYGGLSRGFERIEADRKWFESFGRRAVPTWRLGGMANAAFRACIFGAPDIGLMDETLGPGTETGVGEDTYLFYKILKAGHTIIYEPTSYVWHKHRSDMKSFRRQIYGYSKGHVAYHLTTLINDRDLRAILRLMAELPRWHLLRIKEWLLRRRTYPLSLVAIEILGNLVGPWALWQSRRRVRRERRSTASFDVI